MGTDTELPFDAGAALTQNWIRPCLSPGYSEPLFPHNRILIFRNPEADQYQTRLTATFGDTLSVLDFQGVIIKAEQLLG